MAADGLALPTGLIVAGILGRAFGPDGYGVLALALSIAGAVEWGIAALFSRATITIVSGSDGSHTVSTVLRWHLYAGLAAGAVVGLAAVPLAAVMEEPRVQSCLLVLACGVPIGTLAMGCRNILTGRGHFSRRALAGAIRWIVRVLCIGTIVALGFSIDGAAAGTVLATGLALIATWMLIGGPGPNPAQRPAPEAMDDFWRIAISAFVMAMSLRLLERIGVVALKVFGAPTAEVGWYAAAQNFATAPGLFAFSFAPLLLSTLTRQVKGRDLENARALARDALRAVVLGAPLLAMLAGSSGEIVRLIYGAGFEPAADLAAPFLLVAIATALISVNSAILTAAGHTREVGRAAWPILPIALVGYAFAVPGAGAMGAALVTCAAAAIGAALSLVSVRVLWHVAPPLSTIARALAVSAGAYTLALTWTTPGVWWFVKVGVVTVGIAAAYVVLGEWTRDQFSRLIESTRDAWRTRRDA